MHRINKRPVLSVIFLSVLLSFFAIGSATGQSTAEWPCFHGPDRTNKSAETGLLKKWPGSGPRLLFTISGLGEGYSSVSIAGGYIYTAGVSNGVSSLFAFDMNGKPVWKKAAGNSWSTTASWASSYTGPRSTPTYDSGVLYYLNETGRLGAFDAKTGKELWFRLLDKDFDAPPTEYGYSESVLIDGDRLYVRPAGRKGVQVCLNKNDGSLIWANTDIPGSEGYTSAVIHNHAGYRMITGASSNCYYGVDTRTGRLLWKVDFENQRGLNITNTVVSGENVFITSGYGKGCMLVKLNVSGQKLVPQTVWQTELMDNHHGGVILHNGSLFGSGTNSRGWFCLDFLTGRELWKTDGKGSVTFADGMLYLLDERTGSVKLVKAASEKYEQAGEFRVPSGGQGMYWAHPVVCGGRLYIRHADKIFVYDIRA
ncbi:MAG TPA: PQQ-binding-like beta-propeller repeat protein [Bacteroidales bacterium]|nr:PQQ-binding-like beta-propeller repeat protein [Bacteroidales bacterium]HPF03457.1 PQQ-binding-like beta-propeller repeat protein [Bacteroidales bacterium]HPJ58871.1 PQQ-binding-like beta-propeller repeat protein [Bacteroidales bacterium]HPR11026.1 PQQ-binding-like beta-propeller repeat protein [Bacteroidales bacterium]HRW84447.1 PQQ-binding-like beta-propeller repeat protein [Bacteroidales bacterium]